MPDALLQSTITKSAPQSAGFDGIVPHLRAARRFREALRQHVGRDRMPRIDVAHRSGVSPRSLEGYLDAEENKTPGLANFLSLARTLPEEFTNRVLELAGLTGAYRMGDAPVSEASALTDKLTAAQALAKALEDGRIDHRERAALTPQIRALGSRLLELAAQWERTGS